MTARLIARRVKYSSLDVAYTTALLHDIGKVVLNNYMKESYHEVLDTVMKDNVTFLQAEEGILGFNHAEVGAKIAEKWNLPLELVEAIACHHDLDKAQVNPKLTAIVQLADAICVTMGIGLGLDGMLYPISPMALEILDLQEADIESIIAEMVDVCVDQLGFDI
jgi:putative nucleotidyltransferase with HDIG domain